jgi:ABC-type multidrug transport system fused ATPase/permease subunit
MSETATVSPLFSSPSSAAPIICLRGLSYSYPTRPDQTVLQNISLSFHPRSIHVIIGKSGAGKSTLLSMLCGLYQPSEGEISISSSPSNTFESLTLDWVQHHVGVVEQSAKLFSGTIRENICYGSQVSPRV